MRMLFRSSLLALPLLFLGCTSDNHATWWMGDVAPDEHDCRRAIQGSRAVLDLQEFRSILVVPFAWGGFRLFILTEPTHLEPGTTLTIPGGQANAILCDLSHGASGDAITDVKGSVQVLKRRGQDVLLRLDLEGDEGYWSYDGKQWFERQGAPVESP